MFHEFKASISQLTIPEKFTFPFYYDPDPLALLAASELQYYLETQNDFDHNFGLEDHQEGLVIGKMFGVLVVRDSDGKLGYLRGFSGKLAEGNHHDGFVPPVYDMLESRGFFRQEEEVLNDLNRQVDALVSSSDYIQLKQKLAEVKNEADRNIDLEKKAFKTDKIKRKQIRASLSEFSDTKEKEDRLERLRQESIQSNFRLKDITKLWKMKVKEAEDKFRQLENELDNLKSERKKRSAALQQKLFRSYTFLNADGDEKSLLELFSKTALGRPPAGAGECAAPKLLQYAFKHKMQPIALAEFWWGASPSAEVRKSGNFYPACIGKCKPILSHMLSKTVTDPDPLLTMPTKEIEIETIFEDNDLLIINKPEEFLSVPGRNIKDSVQSRMKEKYPDSDGPMVVHRLDMSTSGLMIIAKNLYVYKNIQRQFSERKVKKRYVALLEGEVLEHSGTIKLPLMLDYNDRPRQCVSFTDGKEAHTEWEKVKIEKGRTRVNFYPKTGRTHQLRVHAAHMHGLNTPIVGDDLYGKKDNRLMLHAAEIEFVHPVTRKRVSFSCPSSF